MAPTRIPGSIGRSGKAGDLADGTMARTVSPEPGPAGRKTDGLDTSSTELHELLIDLAQMALDLAGIADPTPACDAASALISLARGQWLDAALSGVSMVPYVGDLAKAGKLPKYLKSVEKAVLLAERSADFAKSLLPGMEKLSKALDLIPAGANRQIDDIRARVTQFINSRKGVKAVIDALPDISGRFRFPKPRVVTHGGKKYTLREAEGALGVPGKVQTHNVRSSVQKKVSGGSGDDAGHLIGEQFGGPYNHDNLGRQNFIQNEGGGTWHNLEGMWSKKLKEGTGINVRVKEYTPEGANRPLWREAEWDEIAPDGSITTHKSPAYFNSHTADASHRLGSRTKQGIEPTDTGGKLADVIPIRRQ